MLGDLDGDIARAMKAHNQVALSALRMLKAALTNKEIERGRPLEPPEALQVVASQIKQRRESIDQFVKGGRQDLADKEAAEIKVLETYLPPAMSLEEIAAEVDAAIAETGATGPKDMGRVMKAAMARLAGKGADGKTVNELVRTKLAGR